MNPSAEGSSRLYGGRPAWVDISAGIFVLVLTVINAVLLPRTLETVIAGGVAVDWEQFVDAGRRLNRDDLYETTMNYGWRWSPLAAHIFELIGWIGTPAWRVIHLVAALSMPTWPMRLVTLAAWPFWYDVEAGNVMVFVLLGAAWAVRGNSLGAGGFLALTLLVPRPLMLPVAAWVLWKQPVWRLRFAVMVIASAAAVVATGWADEWAATLLTVGEEAGRPNNLGPSRIVGTAWLIVGIPLSVILTLRGRLGWASVAASHPYVLPYYLLMLVLEVPHPLRFGRSRIFGHPLPRDETGERRGAEAPE